jgi:HlyD family secretion protein
MKNFFLLLLLVGAAAGGTYYVKYRPAEHGVEFRSAPVKRGDLILTVGATGTVEPEEVVDIGAQVVGRIKELGEDPRGKTDPKLAGKHVDYGSEVEAGTLLAQIDPSVYRAQWNQAQASLDRASADLNQLKAHATQTEAEWVRAQKLRSLSVSVPSTATAESRASLIPVRGISDADFILARANYQVATANVQVGESVVKQQQSLLDLANTNLKYTTIESPVKGTIIDRRVNIGQTVVSTMNAPSLFLIAKDLRRMQVWASVNEADIGQVKAGTPVTFTVDAFPDDVFKGEVTQIRLNAKMEQNIVTYTVIVTTDNSNLRLLPYLTADVKFQVAKREKVLLVPNSALRYKPRPELITTAPTAEPTEDDSVSPGEEDGSAVGGDTGTVWVKSGEQVYPVHVKAGVTDNSRTEVTSDELDESMQVVLGEKDTGPGEQVNNPFAPKMPRGGGGGRSKM